MKKYLSASSLFLLTGLILFSYISLHVIPLLGTFLGPDRMTYIVVITIAGFLGILFFFLARIKKIPAFFKYFFYLLTLVLMILFPLFVTFRNINSFRGLEWGLITFLTGFIPILILICGLLIWSGYKTISLIFSIIFGLLSLFHLTAMAKIIPRLGKAFSSGHSSDVVINLAILLFTGLCAWINFSYYRSKN